MSKYTDEQKSRLAKMWSEWAKEPITVTASTIEHPIFVFGSEIACLRIAYMRGRHQGDRTGEIGYSENLKTWFYKLNPCI